MKLVVDVPDSTYNDLRYAKQYNPRFLSDAEKIILSGTPLPKGVRLIEADKLLETITAHSYSLDFCISHHIEKSVNLSMVNIAIADAQTIIKTEA